MGTPQKGGAEMNADIMNKSKTGAVGCRAPGGVFNETELSALKKDIRTIAERNISRSQAKNVMLGSPKYSQSLIGWRVSTIPEAEEGFDLLINEVYDGLGLP